MIASLPELTCDASTTSPGARSTGPNGALTSSPGEYFTFSLSGPCFLSSTLSPLPKAARNALASCLSGAANVAVETNNSAMTTRCIAASPAGRHESLARDRYIRSDAVGNEAGFVRLVVEVVDVGLARPFVAGEFNARVQRDAAHPHLPVG